MPTLVLAGGTYDSVGPGRAEGVALGPGVGCLSLRVVDVQAVKATKLTVAVIRARPFLDWLRGGLLSAGKTRELPSAVAAFIFFNMGVNYNMYLEIIRMFL